MNLLNHFPRKKPREGQRKILEEIEKKRNQFDVCVIVAPPAAGKCHAKGQGILMYDGSIKKVEDIEVGDLLMGPDSTPRKVLELDSGINDMVKVIPKRGEPFVVTHNHILPVKRYTSSGRYDRPGGKFNKVIHENIVAEDWFKFSKTRKHTSKLWKPNDVQFPTPKGDTPLHPYLLGLWLGDGTSCGTGLTTMDLPLADWWKNWGESLGCYCREDIQEGNKSITYYLSTKRGKKNPALEVLRDLNVLNNKHIPDRYLFGSREERLELLAGLSDTDGNWNKSKNNFEITQVRESLAKQILFLLRSLGFSAHMCVKHIKGKPYYRVVGSTQNAQEVPVACLRKTSPVSSTRDMKTVGFSIEPAGRGEYYGFEIDGDNLYLLEDFTVTHNTAIAQTIIDWIGAGTYIVPNRTLTQQAIEDTGFSGIHNKHEYPHIAAYNAARKALRGGKCVLNYHQYMANKAYNKILVVDEAHQLIEFLRDKEAVKLWSHLDGFPEDTFQTTLELEEWLQKRDSSNSMTSRMTRMKEALAKHHERYIIEEYPATFRGKLSQCLKLLPLTPRDNKPILWPPHRVEKIFLMSATFNEEDLYDLGLDRRRVLKLEVDSPIDPSRRPIRYCGIGNMGYRHQNRTLPVLCAWIEEALNYHSEKGLLHSTYGLSKKLRKYFKDHPRVMFHTKYNKNEVYRKWLTSDPSCGMVLVACGLYEGISLDGDKAWWQAVLKVPYPNLREPAIAALLKQRPEAYQWAAAKHIIQAVGRVCRTEDDWGVSYLIDSSFERLYKEYNHLFPVFFKQAMPDMD